MKIKFTRLIALAVVAGSFSLSANAQTEANAVAVKELRVAKSQLKEDIFVDNQQNKSDFELRSDTNGRPDSTITYTTSGEKNSKIVYGYDSEGNNILKEAYSWKNGTWIGDYKHAYEYENGLNNMIYSYRWESDDWINRSKSEYIYDATGTVIKYIYSEWILDTWVNQSMTEYISVSDGNETQRIGYNRESDEWKATSVDYTTTNKSGVYCEVDEDNYMFLYPTPTAHAGNTSTVNSGLKYKYGSTYNSFGNLASFKIYAYHVYIPDDISSIPAYSYTIDYKEENKPVLINGLYYNEPNFKVEYQYDNFGNMVLMEMFFRNSDNNTWTVGRYKYTAIYDTQNRIIKHEHYEGVDNKWVLYRTEFYNYDENGNTTTYNYIFKDDKWQVDGYTISYPNRNVPEAEIDNNHPVDNNNQGSFDINVNIPTDSINNGNITITLPDGFTLDEENTTLTLDFAGLFDLKITKQENNAWLIEINPKSTKNALLKSENATTMLHVAYKVDETLVKGTYDISINNILFETKGGNFIPEPAIIVPVSVNRWGVDNEYVNNTKAAVYMNNNTLYIQSTQAETIAVYAPTGIKLYEAKIQSGATTIDAANFPKGVLFVKGSSGWNRKVVW